MDKNGRGRSGLIISWYGSWIFGVRTRGNHDLVGETALVTLFIQYRAREKHFCFISHQGGCYHNELTGQLNIQLFHFLKIVQKIICDFGNGNIIYIKFITFNEEQKQVEWTFKQGQFDLEAQRKRNLNKMNSKTKYIIYGQLCDRLVKKNVILPEKIIFNFL